MKWDIKSRLNELHRTGELQTGRQLAETLKAPAEDRLFPGEGREEETAFGRCYMRELRFSLDHRHGSGRLEGILNCSGPQIALPARDASLESFEPKRAVFLDIETTGLSGGTGTWAFLIGLGWLEENHFLLRQYFLRRPAEERSILSHFAAETDKYPTMITFNGKMFDLPLIQTRQMLAGFRQTMPEQHLDLLQCARVLWKKRLASRSLRSIEESLLGLHRYDDIPGAEIPAVYFDYLRRGKTARLKQVFHHNALDILSMVTLLERIASLGSGQNIEHQAEALALGRLCLGAGRVAEGIGYLSDAAGGNTELLAIEAALELSFYHKRLGQWAEAIEIWLGLADSNNSNPTALIELAKYYEHRVKDNRKALELTLKALSIVNQKPYCFTSGETCTEAIKHRHARLLRKISGMEEAQSS